MVNHLKREQMVIQHLRQCTLTLHSFASSKKMYSEQVPQELTIHRLSVLSTKIHRLDLGPLLTGIALSSVRMHKYSPITAINAMQATLTSHHDRAAGR